ncbi:agmatinase, mitochondrial precursor, partial [Microstroma glucosiphilum]
DVPDFYFTGISTFAHMEHVKCLTQPSAEFDIALIGIPIDTAVSFKPGARFGPRAIRFGSARQTSFRTFNPILGINPFQSNATIVDCGDMPITPFDNSVAFSQIEDAYSALLQHPTPSGRKSLGASSEPRSKEQGGVLALDGKRHPRIASMGGDHSIVLPILRSLHKVYGPITVIHMDAHLDSWQPKAYGSSVWESAQAGYTHGTMFHHAAVEGLTANNSVHLGLRGLLSGADYDDYVHDANCGFSYLETQEMVDMGLNEVARLVKERVGNSPVYLSIDVDVMDPSVAPGTGTPVAGGLLSREVRELIRLLQGVNLVGVDVVEVSPPYDSQAEITALAAAELMYELITIMVL